MKLKHVLSEMTMRVNSYEELSHYMQYFDHLMHDGEHCGDIEEFNVYKKARGSLVDYAVFFHKEHVAFFVLKGDELTDAFVDKDYRKKGLFSAFLMFLKLNEGMSKIVLNDHHSEATIAAVKRIYKRFDTSWVKDDQSVPFDPTVEEPYYSRNGPTGWKIVLENDHDFSDRLKFYDHITALREGKMRDIFYFGPFVDPE